MRGHPCEFSGQTLRRPGADPQGVRQDFGALAQDTACGLAVRHDHGSRDLSDHFKKEIALLGVESSPAFVRAPEGNGCVARFIRTLNENLSGSALKN